MTVAALHAVALRECLAGGLPDAELPARFYAAAAEAGATAWQLAAASDLRHPRVAGRRGLRTRLTNAYVAQVHRAAHLDPLVARTFMRVAHLVEPRTDPTGTGGPDHAARQWRRTRHAGRSLNPGGQSWPPQRRTPLPKRRTRPL
ncbi:hypothetical protein EBN03_08485 [Nocardia stercoris]|uniref:Uncharacterized protein n=1 Tax=Nocardia stercoris TaxID=2483361 RepID=A0A3M2L7A8_9NOCA|nr:hypothetical protein EBN03_08485 [Nocardia stercoris]